MTTTTPSSARFSITYTGGTATTTEEAMRTGRPILVGETMWFIAPPPLPPPPVPSAERTRSARWRAGSRRTRRLVRVARRRGRRSPTADPWAGWQDLGWSTDDGGQ